MLLAFLGGVVAGCLVFAQATGFSGLLLGRVLFGAGIDACPMAPLTGDRLWYGAYGAIVGELMDADGRLTQHGGVYPARRGDGV